MKRLFSFRLWSIFCIGLSASLLFWVTSVLSQPNFWERTNGPYATKPRSVDNIYIDSEDNIWSSVWNLLYRSTDNGENWIKLHYPFANMEDIPIYTNSLSHVFIGVSYDGLYRSTDDTESWNKILSIEPLAKLFSNVVH